MARLTGYFWLAVLAASPGAAQRAPLSRSAAPIALYTGFEHPCPPEVFQGMQGELAGDMAPAGIYFEWRSLDDPAQRNRAAAELAVINFKGSCQMPALPPARFVAGALGWTHISDGELLSFADVNCDRVREVISGKVRRWPQASRERALGRALGRVVAHELFHMFANTRRHASRGLLKHMFGPKDLMDDGQCFEREDLLALRQNKLRWLFQAQPPKPGAP